ncbi:hypothetical protein CHUAL_000581 [Chamberlinius hualienensis]
MLPSSSSQNKRYLIAGEEDDIIRNEKIRRRNARLFQTRSIANEMEGRMITAVKSERNQLLDCLENQLKSEWKDEKAAKISAFGEQYGNCLLQIGEGHENVIFDAARVEVLKEKLSQDQVRSTFRGKVALEEQKCLIRMAQEKTHRKHDLRKKMHAYGNRVGEVVRLPSKIDLPIHIEKENYGPVDRVAKLTADNYDVDDPLESDARLVAEEENRRHLESQQLHSKHKLNQNIKTQERYLLAVQKLQKEKEMNEFINKIEEIDDLNQSSMNASDLEKEREKAVEKLFENLGLPVKLSFTESLASGLSTEISSTVGSQTPVHIILPRRRLNSSITPVNSLKSSGASLTIPTGSSSSSTPNVALTSDSKTPSSYRTDDDKQQFSRSKFNQSETILAGNLQSSSSTINWTESSPDTITLTDRSSTGYPFTISSRRLNRDFTVNKQFSTDISTGLLSNSGLTDTKTNLVEPSNQQTEMPLTSEINVAENKSVEDSKNKSSLGNDSVDQLKEVRMIESLEQLEEIHKNTDTLDQSEPGIFHNVVIRKKSADTSGLPSEELDKVLDERQQQLQNLIVKTIQSKKGFEAFTSQYTKPTSSLSDELSKQDQLDKNIIVTDPPPKLVVLSPPKVMSVPQVKPVRLRRQNLDQDLSTIMEMDTPRSSFISDFHDSHLVTSCDVGHTGSLFDIISDNENGILEERTMTLVSSITSFNSDQQTSDGSLSSSKAVPFIVTNVMVKNKPSIKESERGSTLLGNSSRTDSNIFSAQPKDLLDNNQQLYAGHSLGHTPTIDSLSLHSCMSSSKSAITHLSPLSFSQNSQSLTSDSSCLKSISNGNTKSSDDYSITDDLLSNSLISFLAHEISANSDIDRA